MARIVQLSPHLADLIAAGEVVERPASVVKELVENSIDAGAKHVTVEIQNGGMTFLRVQDDGCGMLPEDAPTAFLRHATSKLRRAEDLAAIGTLGFRGEALAATAAVSRVDLITKPPEALYGTSLHLEAGKLVSQEEVGCPDGTTIVVRDLFFNTPARMKFMKRDSVEASAVASALQKQALAHPEIAFRLIKDGQTQLQTPGDGALLSAVYSVLGRQTAQELVAVESRWEKLSLSGFVTRPTATRGTRSYQIFFVNGRYIKSKTLTAALEEAYRNQIMVGRFPACVLNITMPLGQVDVNVHPAKTEVKFLREKEIFDCVYYGVLSTLNKTPGQVAMELPGERRPAAEKLPARDQASAQSAAKPQPQQTFFRTMTAKEYQQFHSTLASGPKAKASDTLLAQTFGSEGRLTLKQQIGLPLTQGGKLAPPAPASEAPPAPAPVPSAAPASEPAAQTPELPGQTELALPKRPFRVVGEVLDTYIIAEQGTDVILIDKHAAHERINFERLKARGVEVMGQRLLTPLTCELDREEAAALCQNRSLLESLGYDFDDLGDGTLLLRQIPSDLAEPDAVSSLSEIAGHLLAGKLDDPTALRDEALHTIACKAAIKAGYHTDPREREYLVSQVLSREDLKYCPHGRPICVVLTQRQLEKQFKRIQ